MEKRIPSKKQISTFIQKVTDTAEVMGIGFGDAFNSDWKEDNWIVDYITDEDSKEIKKQKELGLLNPKYLPQLTKEQQDYIHNRLEDKNVDIKELFNYINNIIEDGKKRI